MADALEELLTTASGRKPASSSSAAPSADFPKAKIDDAGRLQILMNERSGLVSRMSGKDQEDRVRASKDLESLDREIKALGGSVKPVQPLSLESMLQTQAAPRENAVVNPALSAAQTVPGSPEARQYEQQVRRQATETERKRHLNESFLSRWVAPITEVPLALATSPLGLINEKLAYQPQSPTSQDVMGQLGKAFEASKLEGAMGLPILQSHVNPAASKPVAQGIRAAGTAAEDVAAAARATKERIAPTAPKSYQPLPESNIAGVGAARSEFNPFGGKITGEETARGAYPTVKTSKIAQDVHPSEQKTRASILSEVLGEDATGIRQGVLTGNEDTLRNEHALAKRGDTAAAKLMQEQLAKEQTALSNYAQERVNRTGANQNFVNDYERGQLINDAFAGDEGLTGWFKSQKNQLYDAAKATVGDNPISTSHVDNLLQNKQFRAGLGLKGNEGVAKSAENLIDLAKNTGFEDEFGNFHPANSISAWDAVRKALNQNWTKDNASVIRQINQAIDKDVAAAGGGDLYKAADRMHQAEKTLFGSKGIKTFFGDIDPNGVQTGKAFDVIPKELNSLKFDEWRHIFDTADQLSKGSIKINGEMVSVPEEIRIAAQAAKNEMTGSLTRDIYQAGAGKQGEWSAHAANKRMNALDQKIRHALPPDEVQAMHKLNYAGQLMPTHGYEGAALQASRLERLSEKFPSFGATIGAKAGPAGIAAGQYLGEKTSGILKGRSQRKAAEELQRQFQENLRKGREQ